IPESMPAPPLRLWCCHFPLAGRGSLCDHSLKSLSSRITVRKLQGAWLPAGRGNLEKPVLGPRGSVAPVLGPQNGLHPVHAESSPLKPRVMTMVKLGGHPLRKVTLLLNRRSVQSFEQLLADISEALGFPRWKNDRVRKLFNLKGKEIRSVSDFFREGDAFIAMGKEPLTLKNIQVAVEELYPSKARALTLTQQSRAPSPRLRSRLYSRALRGGHHCGESDAFYEAGRVLGDGNFAVVKECRHRETRQAYAMKIIDKSKLKGKEDMVDSEILIIQSLSHPNIVKLHEVYETDAEIYLIMEYVQGGDLFDAIIESVKFAERDAALMLMDLCRALVHLHDKSIVHRDLKPENLLVQRNEDKSTTLKLADFGLAKHVVRPIFTVCGTPTYVAPEILSEKGYGLEVDMWAAGVILYILLCGFPPFRSPERDQDELFNIIQLGRFEFLAPYWDNISDAAKDLVSRLLVVDPKQRYTAHQVLQHPWIETAGKTSSATLPREVPPSSEGHARSQHRRSAEKAL
uniref:non-specific serine/threonine protein kinase n=1 Tax=Panthera tigris altaica TaxID=74533 RepID=A0A8C9JX41_PANTA